MAGQEPAETRILENNEVRINDLFQEMTKIEAAPGSVDQKISDLYKMGLDSVRLNKEGAEPVKADLAAIMQVEKGPALTKALTVEADFFSAHAAENICAAGGKAIQK